MTGLKTQEGKKFEHFFELVQAAAKAEGGIFFLDCRIGRTFENERMTGEDLRGWLVSECQAESFQKCWAFDRVGEKWLDNVRWVVWDETDGRIFVEFQSE